MDWFNGIVTACLILPLLANWLSGGKISLSQRGIVEPFLIGLLCGVGESISVIVNRQEWEADRILLSLATGIALSVIIVKSVRGNLITKEDEEEDD